jgi:Outer membrane protein beta-barrel domain
VKEAKFSRACIAAASLYLGIAYFAVAITNSIADGLQFSVQSPKCNLTYSYLFTQISFQPMQIIKKMLSFALIAISANALQAQAAWSFGIKAGTGASSLSFADANPSTAPWRLPNVQGGLYATRQFSERFGLRGELGYTVRGCGIDATTLTKLNPTLRAQGGGAGFTDPTDLQISTISIGVLAAYRIAGGLEVEAGLESGPRIATIVRNSQNSATAFLGTGTYTNYLNIGANYHFNTHIFAGLRYNMALAPFDTETKNFSNAVQLSAYYTF